MTSSVNCYDEFSKLSKVIIGRVDNACTPQDEPCYRVKSGGKSQIHGYSGPKNISTIHQANKQLDNLVKILESEDVEVLRPEKTDFKKPIRHVNFEISNQNVNSCPRDIFSILGSTILQAPVSWRSRSMEFLSYKNLFKDLYLKDRQVKLYTAPVPTYKDSMYVLDYPFKHDSIEREQLIDKQKFCITEEEPLFDAADLYQVGDTVLYHHHYWSNNSGFEYLQRHFPEFKFHKIEFTNQHIPSHVDTIINIPRPGVLIKNPVMELDEATQKLFKENNEWEIFNAPCPETFILPQGSTCTPYININMLSLDEDTILVEETEISMHKFLENEIGLNVIKVPFRDFYSSGGILHCCSLDICRKEGKKNYF